MNSARSSNRTIQIAGLVPNEVQASAALSRFRADVNNRCPRFHPFFIVDLDGIVADGNDEIGLIGELLEIAAPRPADHAGPVRMALRQKAFTVQGRDEWNILPLDEFQQTLRVLAASKREAGNQQRPRRARSEERRVGKECRL